MKFFIEIHEKFHAFQSRESFEGSHFHVLWIKIEMWKFLWEPLSFKRF